MECLVPHVLFTSSDTRSAISGGSCYECFDNRPAILICETQCASTSYQLEIGCSPVIVTSRTGTPTGRAWLTARSNPYSIYSCSVCGSLKYSFKLLTDWFIS